jgi:hypothetical protein
LLVFVVLLDFSVLPATPWSGFFISGKLDKSGCVVTFLLK